MTSRAGLFGILEGGRGIVEAILGSIAVAWFAWTLSNLDASTPEALRQVILIYVGALLIMAPVTWLTLSDIDHDDGEALEQEVHVDTVRDAKIILAKPEVWLAAICILCGYSLFYATYSFAGYLQTELGLSAVMVGWITLGRLWMRPIGGILAGFVGDHYRVDRVLSILLALCSISLAGMIFLPTGGSVAVILLIVLVTGLFTYAVRGIFWSTLDSCDVPNHVKGLAIGIISLHRLLT
ncbi:MAG: MFS transporter [Gammaproteobacteria bacterium]|nr:MFS transporter [Gammaproteobacteria bacterium]